MPEVDLVTGRWAAWNLYGAAVMAVIDLSAISGIVAVCRDFASWQRRQPKKVKRVSTLRLIAVPAARSESIWASFKRDLDKVMWF